MKNKKEFLNVKKQFKEAIEYLKKSSKYILFSVVLFIASALVALLNPQSFTFLDKILAELINKTINLNGPELILFILQNNLQSSFFAIIFGSFLGFFPVFSIIANGVVIGYVLALTLKTAGIASWWRLLPHGIFELPAVFISFGLGIKLGFSILNKKVFKENFYNSINVLLMIIVPLLIIAAIIEGLLIIFLS